LRALAGCLFELLDQLSALLSRLHQHASSLSIDKIGTSWFHVCLQKVGAVLRLRYQSASPCSELLLSLAFLLLLLLLRIILQGTRISPLHCHVAALRRPVLPSCSSMLPHMATVAGWMPTTSKSLARGLAASTT
jgi:hypothetical protein